MEISINLNVLFDLTARMAKTLTALAGRPAQPAPAPTALPEPAESDKPTPAPEPVAPAPEPAAPASEPAAPAPEPVAPAPAQAKELTAEDVRDAIHRTRLRFEGNYTESTDTEEYKRYHGALNTLFKQSAMALAGVKKPSLLPPDKIADFIADCEGITMDENGDLIPAKAPF